MEMIAIGRIRTSHGVKGFVKVLSFSGEVEHFYDLNKLLLKKNDFEKHLDVEEIKPLGDSIIIKFGNIDTPEKAKSLSGWEIWVPRENAASLRDGEYYHVDLCLCELQYRGKSLGRIISVLDGGGGELFEVQLTSGQNVLIPFRDEFIGEISIDDKFIELKEKWILG